ncbi:PEP-CTERM sorting domain-containing protein [Sedimenticola hydrogenitrophicus]|uniref:PEP-CTERM sorting domain-containing protein n=1 Tax=Sedimenticola hydrogenitrophicus TaxID=2967975 RepID=UPI0021A6DA63|nr:PEP-CTERM sorting domain-containing protein [Sedimenticola hydrogenitrophicus]
MSILKKSCAAVAGLLLLSTAHAATIDLTGLGFVTYGDGQSYSLPIANYQYGFSTNNGPYAIPSTPGQIQDLVVLNTGSEGQQVTTNFAGMDDAYSTPTGSTGGETFFYSSTTTDRGFSAPEPTGNLDTTWDTSLSALQTFTAGEELVFFFNNNQTNSGTAADQTLAAWARLWITAADGTTVVAGSTFEFTNDDSPYAIVTEGGGGTFFGDPTLYTATGSGAGDPTNDFPLSGDTDWVVSGGQLCVASNGSNPIPIPVSCGISQGDLSLLGDGTLLLADVSAAINHNLGADHVAYAVIFPELNALLTSLYGSIADLSDYTLHVDVRYGCEGDAGGGWMDCLDTSVAQWGNGLNNGYEQLFIGTAITGVCPPDDTLCNPTVPEPATLALMGLGLAGIGIGYRRRRVKAEPENKIE